MPEENILHRLTDLFIYLFFVNMHVVILIPSETSINYKCFVNEKLNLNNAHFNTARGLNST
jgi:hypothetical protein